MRKPLVNWHDACLDARGGNGAALTVRAIAEFRQRYGGAVTAYVLLAVAVWLFGLIVLPQLQMLEYSFWRLDRTESAVIDRQIEDLYREKQKIERELRAVDRQMKSADADKSALEQRQATLRASLEPIETQIRELETREVAPKKVYGPDNYVHFLTSDLHRGIFLKTIWASMIVTLIALIVCYPVAFYVAHVASGDKAALLLLALIVPYWVNELLRTLSWLMILSLNGLANTVLRGLGLIDQPIEFLESDAGVIIGMTYAYVLFMVFPIYNTMETLDHNQLEAARDLGAPWWRIHWRIVIPHAKPGIAVGCIMVFMLAAGSFAVPQILGGTSTIWFTEVIYSWFFDGSNWNMGSAYAMGLLGLCVVFILLMMRLFRVRLEDIARG